MNKLRKTKIESLSDDLLFYLFNYFHPIEQNELRLVCKRWRQIIKPKDFEHRLYKPFEINISPKFRVIQCFLCDGNFIYLTTLKCIAKINKLNGRTILKKYIPQIYTLFNYDENNLISISQNKILIISKKNLKVVKKNKIKSVRLIFYKIYYINNIIFIISLYGYIYLFDITGKEIKKIRNYTNGSARFLKFGISNNIYVAYDDKYIRVWKFKTNTRIASLKFNNDIIVISFDKNYNFCAQDSNNNIYICSKENKIIKKVDAESIMYKKLSEVSINNYFLFKSYNQALMLNNLNNIDQNFNEKTLNGYIFNYYTKTIYCKNNILYIVVIDQYKNIFKILQY